MMRSSEGCALGAKRRGPSGSEKVGTAVEPQAARVPPGLRRVAKLFEARVAVHEDDAFGRGDEVGGGGRVMGGERFGFGVAVGDAGMVREVLRQAGFGDGEVIGVGVGGDDVGVVTDELFDDFAGAGPDVVSNVLG